MKFLLLLVALALSSMQKATSQDSTVVPQAFPATSVGGSGQGCPTEEEWAAARNEVLQEVYAQIVEQFGVTPSPLPGERGDFPASSCQQIAELSPDSPPGNYWIIAPNGSAVLVYCNMNAIGQTEEFPASSCQQIAELDPSRPSGFYWVRSSNGTAVRVYCDMTRECCGTTGGWTRVAFLNMTDPGQQCPPVWHEISSPIRTCGRLITTFPGGCDSVFYDTHGIEYSQVCGRVIGYQHGDPDAFRAFTRSPTTITIDDLHHDGVSITYGSNPRQHIWTFVAAYTEGTINSDCICPCTNTNGEFTHPVPPWVQNAYFCETAQTDTTCGEIFYANDPLWDGEGCGPSSTCCSFNGPPWFCQSLDQPTTEDIEVRLCTQQDACTGDVPIELVEIYVQ